MASGVRTIAIFTIFLMFQQIIQLVYNLWHQQFQMWYCYLYFTIMIPHLVATSLFVQFLNDENEQTRQKIRAAPVLLIFSFLLLALWNFTFLKEFYEPDELETISKSSQVNLQIL